MGTWGKTAGAALIFILTIFLLKSLLQLNQFLEALISLIVAGLLYVGICFIFKLVKRDELKLFISSLIKKGK